MLSIIQMKAFCFCPFTKIQINMFCIFSYYKEIVCFSFTMSGGFMSSCALMEKPSQMRSHNVILTSSECSCSILEIKMCAGSGRKSSAGTYEWWGIAFNFCTMLCLEIASIFYFVVAVSQHRLYIWRFF